MSLLDFVRVSRGGRLDVFLFSCFLADFLLWCFGVVSSCAVLVGALTSKGMNALMACANNLDMPIEDWTVGGVPITMMCHMERRKVSREPRFFCFLSV